VVKDNLDKGVYVRFGKGGKYVRLLGTVQAVIGTTQQEWQKIKFQIRMKCQAVFIEDTGISYSGDEFIEHIDRFKGIERRKDE